MYCINRLCFVCLNENNLSKISGNLTNNVIYEKLRYCFPEINISTMNSCMYICSSCHSLLRDLYMFKKMCVRNFLRWNNYVNIISKNNNNKKNLRIFVYSTSKHLSKRKKYNLCVSKEEEITGKELCVYKNNTDYTVPEKSLQIANSEYDEMELLFDDIDLPDKALEYNNDDNDYISEQNDESIDNDFHSDLLAITNGETINEEDRDSQKELFSEKEEVERLLLGTNNTFEQQKEQSIEERIKDGKKGGTWLRNKRLDLKKIVVCHICDKVCDDDKQLQSHQFRQHPQPKMQCSICNRFIRSENMETHKKFHESMNYECYICNLKFNSNKDLLVHKREHGVKEFNCAMCNRGFPRKESLERHIKSHLGIKDYECTQCGKKFVQKNALAIHTRYHLGIKNKKCEICGEAFLTKKYLNIHMETHTNVDGRQYECDVCHKRYRDKTNYNVHVKLHKGIKEYQCPICPKAYGYKNLFRLHILTHSNLIKEYNCQRCNTKFDNITSFEQHMFKHS